MASKSWSCAGCTNTVDMITPQGDVATYCRQIVENGGLKTKWAGDYVYCTAYTTDEKRRIRNIQMYLNAAEERQEG